jgi:cyclohexanecarboxylate-CoA ligase
MFERLTDRVAAQARRHANDRAIVDVRPTGVLIWTWGRLWRESERVAALLMQLGVEPGAVVAYQLPNRVEFLAITLAALQIGAICAPLSPTLRARELTLMLNSARARVLFTLDEFQGRRCAHEIAAEEEELPYLEHVIVLRASGGSTRLPRTRSQSFVRFYRALAAIPLDATPKRLPKANPSAVAQLVFTAGTSGIPKGVLHRQDILMQAAALQARRLSVEPGDTLYVPSPLAHQTGFLYGMWVALAEGIPQIIQGVWNAGRGLRALKEWHATVLQAAPTFLYDLVEVVEAGEVAPESLRVFVPTGAPVPPALAKRAAERLRTKVCGAFGTTEGCLATLASPFGPPDRAAGMDGKVLPQVEIRVCDDRGRPLAPGCEGHLETRSPTMFEGYLDDPERTASAYTADGWYRTGDFAVIAADGYLQITGRATDGIDRGGEKIPVAEIEQILYQHEGIQEVAIVSMPDARLGEKACAFVVIRDGARLDLSAMQSFLDEKKVAKPYWPERLEILEALPKTASGKIRKYLLRERVRALLSGATPEAVA